MRLIDADALMKAIRDFRWIGVPNTLQLMFSYLKIIIRDQPTIDAVPVVRCKDCEYGEYAGLGKFMCDLHEFVGKGDFYCASGERKGNGKV